MKLHDIYLMGINQNYLLPPNSQLPDLLEIEGSKWRIVPAIKPIPLELFDIKNMRTIIVRSRHMSETISNAYVHYLYWQNGEDLSVIDTKVVSESILPNDFRDALVCSYNYIRCIDSCRNQWHALVAVDIDYLVSPSKDENIEKLGKFEEPVCPNCGVPFRIPVIRIFDQSE